jgi:putative aldouronate transport system permease protein
MYKHKERIHWENLPVSIILLLFGLLCILPFWLVLAGSLTSEEEIVSVGYGIWPKKVDLSAYRILLNDFSRISQGYRISVTVTVVGTVLSLFVISMAAYPISQERVKYHSFLNFYVLFTMLFSGGMVPWFIVCRSFLHLTDSIWALILPYLANAWYIFLVRNYYKSIPGEMVEAAKIDGASEYRIFFQIIFPLAKPVIATIALFISLNYWNDWWLGIMLIDDTDRQPLQLLLRTITSNLQFLSSSSNVNAVSEVMKNMPSEAIKMATCIATIGPIILVYPFVQKYFVKGIMVGAVKG